MGNAVIDNFSKDVQTELPGIRGFSSKNLRNIRLFFEKRMSITKFGSQQLPKYKRIKLGSQQLPN
jgi:hypothetical protein